MSIKKSISNTIKSMSYTPHSWRKHQIKSRKRRAKNTKCPLHKDLNLKTNRCVKKCKSGFTRNKNFKCRKNTLKIHTI
jgi:hypothetical protein